jgi:redox-sensing transcriptional repressor
MIKTVPKPTIVRICHIYRVLGELENDGVKTATSGVLGDRIGVSAHSVRKDLSLLGETGTNGARYNVSRLRVLIGEKLGLNAVKKACIVGVGRLGQAIIDYGQFALNGYEIVAGFDSSVNRLETIKTQVKLYPAYQIPEIVKSEGIELAILTVPSESAQLSADRLVEGGIKGIVNFTPTVIKFNKDDLFVVQIDVVREMHVLSALISLSSKAGEESQ